MLISTFIPVLTRPGCSDTCLWKYLQHPSREARAARSLLTASLSGQSHMLNPSTHLTGSHSAVKLQHLTLVCDNVVIMREAHSVSGESAAVKAQNHRLNDVS